MDQEFFIVDAFTDQPFSGNPAAVVPLSEFKSEYWMQSVANEFNLSETAFVDVVPPPSEPRSLRWFTPNTGG